MTKPFSVVMWRMKFPKVGKGWPQARPVWLEAEDTHGACLLARETFPDWYSHGAREGRHELGDVKLVPGAKTEILPTIQIGASA